MSKPESARVDYVTPKESRSPLVQSTLDILCDGINDLVENSTGAGEKRKKYEADEKYHKAVQTAYTLCLKQLDCSSGVTGDLDDEDQLTLNKLVNQYKELTPYTLELDESCKQWEERTNKRGEPMKSTETPSKKERGGLKPKSTGVEESPRTYTSTNASLYDTLFIWKGSMKAIEISEITRFRWVGDIVECIGCVDGRCCPTPTEYAYRRSDQHFLLESQGSEDKISLFRSRHDGHFLAMSPITGWKLNKAKDDDNEVHASTETQKNPTLEGSFHQIYVMGALEILSQYHLAVAKGKDESGSFIAAGYMQPSDKVLTMVRRYLRPDDTRLNWSLVELRSWVQIGVAPPLDEGPWNLVLNFLEDPDEDYAEVLSDVIQSSYLHSSTIFSTTGNNSNVRNIDHDEAGYTSVDTNIPGLYKYSAPKGTEFQLRLWLESDLENIRSNTMWDDQCWGCAQSAAASGITCLIEDCQQRSMHHVRALGYGQFCSESCVIKAVPQFVNVSKQWWQQHSPNSARNMLLMTDEADMFWSAIEKNEYAKASIVGAGWRYDTKYERWILSLLGEDEDTDYASGDGEDEDEESDGEEDDMEESEVDNADY